MSVQQEAEAPTRTVTDPVCGMSVDTDSKLRHEHSGETHVFCSRHCLERFKEDPGRFLGDADATDGSHHGGASSTNTAQDNGRAQGSAGTAGDEHTCPMHPEVVQDHPGSCPKCGMALEPQTVAGEERNAELEDMTRRFWVSAALALPVFVLAMAGDFAAGWLPAMLEGASGQWIQGLLATPVVLWGGWPFFVRAWQSL